MLVYDIFDDEKSESVTVCFMGNERIEESRKVFVRDSRTVIFYMNIQAGEILDRKSVV